MRTRNKGPRITEKTAPTLHQRATDIIAEHSANIKLAASIVVMLLCIALIGAVDPEVVR